MTIKTLRITTKAGIFSLLLKGYIDFVRRISSEREEYGGDSDFRDGKEYSNNVGL